MPRTNPKGFIKIDDLKEKLNDKKSKKSKEELLKEALEKEIISEEEYNASLPIRRSVLKCYLYSIVSDVNKREIIDKYVKYYSQMYIRGTYIANLLTSKVKEEKLFELIENDDIFKQIFLPERWPTKTVKLHSNIETIRDQYNEILSHLFPNDYKRLMCNTGWDNALNMMYTKYRANIQNHICLHLFNNCCKYLRKATKTTDKKLVLKVFTKKRIDCPSDMDSDDYELIMELIEYFGDNNHGYINKFIDYNVASLKLHLRLVKSGYINSTYLPVASFGRKYAYLDTKIAQNLFKDKKDNLVDILGIDFSYGKEKRKKILIRKINSEKTVILN